MYRLGFSVLGLAALVTGAVAEPRVTYSLYGTPGLIEMPTAQAAPDGELAFSFSYAGESIRNSLTFQISPRLSGTFRYSKINKWDSSPGARFGGDTFDRSFDLRYQVLTEGPYRPAMTVGVQDFIGTGIYSGEYVVGSKTLGPVVATGGIGWGRFGSYNGFDNPLNALSDKFDTRPVGFSGVGGEVEFKKWFRGDAALFGGLAWAVNDRLTVKAEYSSDAQVAETTRDHFDRKSPLNFGIDYRTGKRGQLSLYSVHGSEIGVMYSLAIDPKSPPNGTGFETAPSPVGVRPAASLSDLGWTTARAQNRDALMKALTPALDPLGIDIEGMELGDKVATIRIRNKTYGAQAQAVGRMARVLSNVLPGSIETFRIVPMLRGIPGSAVVISRSALERLEHTPEASAQMLAATSIVDAADVDRRAGLNPAIYPKFNWGFGPYARGSLFDPDEPIRVEVGLELDAQWNPTPGLYFSGALRAPLAGNMDKSVRASNSVIAHVRSDGNVYDREADKVILDHLTGSYYFRPGENLYGRVTAGYLERMYGGVSTELLWKPVGSRLALGAEMNYVKQRSYDGGLGFSTRLIDDATFALQDLSTYPETSYAVATGHVSAYYAFGSGFHGQLDVGRYLAGDVGATVSLDREFGNGFKVGAYATLTDVSFEDFGEGSFNKGIRLSIPLGWQTGSPSRKVRKAVIQPVSRDGGARLDVQDRLYELVRDTHTPDLEGRWGRFWR